jgi:hypothetical protein
MWDTGKNKCVKCGWCFLTWAETKRSYGQMLRAGFSEEVAKTHGSVCYRCVRGIIKEKGATVRRKVLR